MAVNMDIRNIILHYLISSGKFSSTFTFLFFLLGSSSTSKIFQSTLGPISLPSCATTLPDLSILLRQLNLKHDCIQNITVLTCRFFSFLNQRIGRWPCNLSINSTTVKTTTNITQSYTILLYIKLN